MHQKTGYVKSKDQIEYETKRDFLIHVLFQLKLSIDSINNK